MIVGWIKRFLSAPTFEDEDKTRAAGLVNGILLVVLAGAALFRTAGAIVSAGETRQVLDLVSGATIVVLVGLKLLLHRGYVRLAGTLLCLVIWTAFTIPVYTFDGIRDTALGGYFTVIVMSSLMLGGRALFAFSLLSSIGVATIYVAETSGLFVSSLQKPPIAADLLTVLIALNTTALLSGITVRRMTEGYERARRNARALREERDRAQRYLDIAGAIIIALDAAQRVTLINRKGCTVLEYGEDEILSRTWCDTFVPEGIREEVEAVFDGLMEGRLEANEHFENAVLTRSGEERLIAWHNVPLVDEAGKTIGVLSSGQDITERVRAQEALKVYSEQLEQMVDERTRALRAAQEQLVRREKLVALGQLAGGVSHELRNPLGAISNAAYYLNMVLSDIDETVKESIELITRQVHNATKIVSDLLDFARVRASDPHAEAVSALVEQTLSRCPVPENVRVSLDVPADLPKVLVDAQQMEQVLVNLITNACQAMPEGGDLALSARVEEDLVALSVADTGHGMSAEHMERLFEPLFTTKARGMGLGLATSQTLAEANGGSIEAESQVDRGSVFTVRIPRYVKGDPEQSTQQPPG